MYLASIQSLRNTAGAMIIARSHTRCSAQTTLPASAKASEVVLITEGSGVKIQPRWVIEKGGGPVCEGCRVIVQMNANLFMATLPPVLMNFIFKVRVLTQGPVMHVWTGWPEGTWVKVTIHAVQCIARGVAPVGLILVPAAVCVPSA
jgi:hypothetical protein